MTSRDASTRRATGPNAEVGSNSSAPHGTPSSGRERRSGARKGRRGTYAHTGKLTVELWRDERFLALPERAKLVCLFLAARHADAEAKAWPRMKQMAAALSCERSTVQRAIKKAEKSGILKVVSQFHDADGHQTSNTYYFDPALTFAPDSDDDDGLTAATAPHDDDDDRF